MAYWAEKWAKDFHETYERTAPQFGYKTRTESAKPWEELPEPNRRLMIAVCAEVLSRFAEYRQGEEPAQDEAANIVKVKCDGLPCTLPRGECTGRNLRTFFGVSRNDDLWFDARQGDDILIEPDHTPYFVDHDDRFYTGSKEINS